MLWLAVHFPQLHLDSVTQVVDSDEREGSQLPERACLIVDGKQQVCQRNCAAELQGIELGMKLGTASALVDDLFFFELDEGLEHRKLKELAGLCYGLSADVVIRNEHACLLIEFSSMLKLYGSSQRYIKAFTALLNQQRIRYRLGLASSPLLAEFLARFLKMEPSELNAAYAVGLLAKLPVCCLDLPDAQIKKLQRLGLELIEDVQALPYDELAMRLGKDSIAYLKRLEPQANPPLTRFSPPEYFSLSIGFDEEVHVSTALLFPIKRLLESLECFLRQRSFQVQSLSLMMFTRQKRIQNIEVFSAQAELLAEHWHKLLRLKLESTTLEAPVMGLALETGPFVQFEIEAQDFFQAPNHQRSIASTLSKLEARLGEGRLRKPALRASHVPEQSFEYQRIDAPKEANKRWEVTEPLREYAKQTLRPSLLLKQPEMLAETIRIIHGPERVQSAWWHGQEIRRDYFVATNEHQQVLWVFRDADQQWFVHGLFA